MKYIKVVLCTLPLFFSLKIFGSNIKESKTACKGDLKYIGMPISGITTGQIYLGGDGQLWNWDIFNVSRNNPGGGGDKYYLNPMSQEEWFANGFAIVVKEGRKEYRRRLNSSGFSDISFSGEYPIGRVSYRDNEMPIEVNLEAYTPFIPTDEDNSALPITILEYVVTNSGVNDIEIELGGWLQNMAAFQCGDMGSANHINSVEKSDKIVRINLTTDIKDQNSLADWGSLALTLLGDGVGSAKCDIIDGSPRFYSSLNGIESHSSKLGEPLIGGVSRAVKLKVGESEKFTFILSWDFPNVHLWNGGHHWYNRENLRHYYSEKFESATEVSNYLLDNMWLVDATKEWNSCWYDTSIPKWFMNRTFVNVSTLATTATIRFDDLTDDKFNEGRYYNFEGVYLGEGSCTHVSHYEQVLGRIFPTLAQHHREQIDLSLSLTDEGVISYRGELSAMGQHDGRGYAVDGQAGTILRIYREHLMSEDGAFLKRNWDKIKLAIQYMINHDKELNGSADGLLEGIQYNTLDRMWYGKISWISSLYCAALLATEQMAESVGDRRFAKECRDIATLSSKNISSQLFNGEYFIQLTDPNHPESPNSNNGCHIDQLLGHYWATQLNLKDVADKDKIVSALQSIMRYNFVDNYDKFLLETQIPISRWYATGDEKGVVMCTFPKGGANLAPGEVKNEWEKLVVGYFSEIWSGQEHALAASLISEGFVADGFKVVEAIDKRYSPDKRNPYNEIEYGNHYTRAMSGYAPFIALTGFFYNGPKSYIEFNPKGSTEYFKTPFITAKGWGSYEQHQQGDLESYSLTVRYGELKLKQIAINSSVKEINSVIVTINGRELKSKVRDYGDGKFVINFDEQTLTRDNILNIQRTK